MPSPHLADLPGPEGPTLQSYLDWFRRRWWILALAALLGIGVALLASLVQTKTYTSTTSVLVRQTAQDSNPNAKVNLDTEAQLVRSLVVAERAKNLMRTDTTGDELVRALSVTVPPNSQIMQITFGATSPTEAQSGSHSFAQAYLDLRLATATRALENETNSLQQQISEVNKQLATVAGRIAAAPANSVERARAEADRSVLTNQLASLNSRLSPLLSTSLDPGEIISDAPLPKRPSSPNLTLNLASGLGAGLLLGIVLALVLDRLDTRVRRGRDITSRTGLPALLDLPAQIAPLAILSPNHRISRELGRLRNVLLSSVPEPTTRGRGRQLLLTDTSGAPVAGFIAGNLGAAYARTGQQVVVLSTRADSPLPDMLGVPARHTLADVLRRDVTVFNALTPVPGLNHLRVLLPGDLDAEAELPVATMLELLNELAARFDHVLIETAQPTLAVEAQALSRHVDAVLLVVERGGTRHSEITAALRQFEQVEAQVLGVVLAPRPPASTGSGATTQLINTVGGGSTTTTGTRAPSSGGTVPTVAGRTESGRRPSPTPPVQRNRRPSPNPRVEPADGQPATDSTVILPRVTDTDGRPGVPGQSGIGAPDPGQPSAGKPAPGQSTLYRSVHGELNGNDTTTRISMSTESGEDRE